MGCVTFSKVEQNPHKTNVCLGLACRGRGGTACLSGAQLRRRCLVPMRSTQQTRWDTDLILLILLAFVASNCGCGHECSLGEDVRVGDRAAKLSRSMRSLMPL